MIHILGAGAIGCLWASRLTPSDYARATQQPLEAPHPDIPLSPSVSFIYCGAYRQRLPNRVASTLLSYEAPDIEHAATYTNIRFNWLSGAMELEPGLILVTTKSHQTLSALLDLAPYLSARTPLVLFQNGMGSQENVLEHFSELPIYAAVSTEGANLHGRFQVRHAGLGQTYVGPLSNPAQALGTQTLVNQLAKSRLKIEADQHIKSRLIDKLLINCAINPFTALEGCRNGEVPETPTFKRLWPSLRRELQAFSALVGHPRSGKEIEQMALKVISATAQNISSMLQDVRAGKETEIESINGYVSTLLSRHLEDNQSNQFLTERVRALRN